jgi:hypothetical protein
MLRYNLAGIFSHSLNFSSHAQEYNPTYDYGGDLAMLQCRALMVAAKTYNI